MYKIEIYKTSKYEEAKYKTKKYENLVTFRKSHYYSNISSQLMLKYIENMIKI